MCKWLEDAMDFPFPEPIEVDMDGVEEGQASVVLRQRDAPLPEPPPMFRAGPAVKEAQLITQGKSISRAIPDGRVVR